MRRRMILVTLVASVGALLPAVPAAAACPSPGGATIAPADGRVGDVVFRGGGLGHGLGMSQYGANGAAKLGCTHEQILETYYRGASLASNGGANEVVVGIVDLSHQPSTGGEGVVTDVTVTSSSSLGARAVSWRVTGCSRSSDCTSQPPAQQPGERWRVIPNSAGQFRLYRFDGGTRQATPFWTGGAAGATLVADHEGTVLSVQPTVAGRSVNSRSTRWGHLELVTTSSTRGGSVASYVRQRIDAGRDTTTSSGTVHQGIDRYLWGLHEVSSGFEPAAQRAQAVAARTYAQKRIASGIRSDCRCHVVTTPADQNWIGWGFESGDVSSGSRWRAAVNATASQVMRHDGTLITALYSSSHGGHSESRNYVFFPVALDRSPDPNHGGFPYLAPVDDSRWDLATDQTTFKNTTYRAWSAGFSWSDLRARLNAAGGDYDSISDVTVARPVGDDDRQHGVLVSGRRNGSNVTDQWSGWEIREALDLHSPNFVVEVVQNLSGGVPISGDWDGNGTEDAGWYDDGEVALRLPGSVVRRYRYGTRGDVPVVGDFDGDGVDTVSIIRDRVWHITNDQDGGAAEDSFIYGRITAGDLPLAGDWDGDGVDGVGIVRRGEWHLRNDVGGGAGQIVFVYGRVLAGDIPVTGDWDGDGDDTVGIVRGVEWHLRYELAGGAADRVLRYGDASAGDRPVPGDWDGDRDTSTGIVRGSRWLLRDDLLGGAATREFTFAG